MMTETKMQFDPLALANGRPVRPSGMDSGPVFVPGGARPASHAEARLAAKRLEIEAAWSHKKHGTAQTHEHVARRADGPLARLYLAGSIDADQLAWAEEIGETAELIERDVAVRVISYEPRIDNQSAGRDALVEGIMRVRREWAYSRWRSLIPHPTRAVLDMLVGEPIAFSTVALRYRMGKNRARRMLIDSIDLWPGCMEMAEEEIDAASVAAAHMGLI